jgi:monooxygenase
MPGVVLTSFSRSVSAWGGTWDLFPLPRNPLRLGYVHPRLSVPPWRNAKAIADGPVDQGVHRRDGPSIRTLIATSVCSTSWCRRPGRRTTRGGTVTLEVGAARRYVQMTCMFLHSCAGYYDYADGYTPAWEGCIQLPRTSGASAALAGGARLRRPTRAGDRERRHGGHACFRHSRRERARRHTSPCCSGLPPTWPVLPSSDAIANALRAILASQRLRIRSHAGRILRVACFYFWVARAYPALFKTLAPRRRAQAPGDGLPGRRAFSHRATSRGMNDSALFPTATCSTRLRDGRASIVTDRIVSL